MRRQVMACSVELTAAHTNPVHRDGLALATKPTLWRSNPGPQPPNPGLMAHAPQGWAAGA